MSLLTDMLAAFDRWEEWKKMRAAPGRIDALEARLDALEKAPPEKAGEPCPACGKPALRRTKQTEKKLGVHVTGFNEEWTCGACGEIDRRSTVI